MTRFTHAPFPGRRRAVLGLALAAAIALGSAGAQAQRIATCSQGTLAVPTPGTPLQIKNRTCKVPAGTYKFGDVHVLAGGVLEFEDARIDFWAANILVENGGSLVAGSEAQPIGTASLKDGSGNAIPARNRLTIHLYGKDQTGTDPTKRGRGVPCKSDDNWRCGVPDALWTGNSEWDAQRGMWMPKARSTVKKIPEFDPAYPAQKDDYFYAYNPPPLDDGNYDAEHAAQGEPPLAAGARVGYFGYKVLGVGYGGTLELFGTKGALRSGGVHECGNDKLPTSSGTSWMRLDKTIAGGPGATTVEVDRPVRLEAGDEIIVTTTDYLPGHSEVRRVAEAVNCGRTITVTKPFDWQHNGARFPIADRLEGFDKLDPTLVASGAETRAAVAILSRSIRIVSEGDDFDTLFEQPAAGEPTPAEGKWEGPTYHFGGHVMARQGFKSFQVQGVEFKQLGQGGRIGHYPIHFHVARRVAPDTFVRDSTINESMTRWVVLHGTQDVLLERNVGYKSIGHGFYLEDGSEINNTFTANLGVFARAAIDNVQNPRKVPGILAAPDLQDSVGDSMPYRSDYNHPTVFWIMNGYNTFTDNMAVGAGTCGVCYWLLGGVNSTMSRDLKWESYASMQSRIGRGGMAPLKSFVGNSCSTAMTAFQTIRDTEACQGVGPVPTREPFEPTVQPIRNDLAPRSAPPDKADAQTVAAVIAARDAYYPTIDDGGHFSTRCDGDHADCSELPDRCGAGALGTCMVTTLDRFTTSFNWAAFNFAAIWLRPQWYLVTDSVITDVQQAGLTMVTGGGYTESDVVPGHWALVRRSVFIGHTQEGNPYASNGGPFNPGTPLRCAPDKNGNRPIAYCLAKDEGISHQQSNWGMYQRLFSVYDGPAYQESNAYLNITKRTIDDCKPFVDSANTVGRCEPVTAGQRNSAWIAGHVLGLPKRTEIDPTTGKPKIDPATGKPVQTCYMPNAAIGWKQPNGFYYPPAFHSANLYFDAGVEVRHFVISPPFDENSYAIDFTKNVEPVYCKFEKSMFDGFAGNDRQTVLNDDDGTLTGQKVPIYDDDNKLTGYRGTTVINLDAFFNAPVDAKECRSEASSRTSPYEYLTTVVYPECAITGRCARPPTDKDENGNANPRWNDGDWNRSCTSEKCYGVPLWRLDQMPKADEGITRSIRMMGQSTGQRSTLTVNHGSYYLDTTVSRETQLDPKNCTSTDPVGAPCVVNVFKDSETYYLFLIFATEDTTQKYRFTVGPGTSFDPGSIRYVRATINKNPIPFKPITVEGKDGKAVELAPKASLVDPAKGIVEVEVSLQDIPGIVAAFGDAERLSCGPATYCKWNTAAKDPVSAQALPPRCEGIDDNGAFTGRTDVCRWAGHHPDCPAEGCIGIKFTLPSGFRAAVSGNAVPIPAPSCIRKDARSPWNVVLQPAADPNNSCPAESDMLPPDFCS